MNSNVPSLAHQHFRHSILSDLVKTLVGRARESDRERERDVETVDLEQTRPMFQFCCVVFFRFFFFFFSPHMNFCSKAMGRNKRSRSGLTKRRIDGMRTTSRHLLWRTTKILTHFSNPTIPCSRSVPGAPFILSPPLPESV